VEIVDLVDLVEIVEFGGNFELAEMVEIFIFAEMV
jgi:hypothetical protein